MGTSTCRGSTYALSKFSHCPNYACRIPIVNPELIFQGAYIRKDIWVSLQETKTMGVLHLEFNSIKGRVPDLHHNNNRRRDLKMAK